jgi:hypothetical protein
MASVLQDWVQNLGLRFQGVLVSGVRGCDVSPRHDLSKIVARIYRAEILRTHAGDPKQSKSFILHMEVPAARERMQTFLEDCDHYPLHYIMHFVHAAEILGYYHPDPERRDLWNSFYREACKKFHLRPESKTDLDKRLEAPEDVFHAQQQVQVRARTHAAREYGGT